MTPLSDPSRTAGARLPVQLTRFIGREREIATVRALLAPLSDPELIPRQIVAGLGLREQGVRPALELLLEALRERFLLLVLDNCEHLVDACARLAETLLRSCPAQKILTLARMLCGRAPPSQQRSRKMAQIQAVASAAIDASPEVVYAIIADYRQGHPQILPEKYFLGLDVEQGGVGAGTVIRCQMRVLGKTHTFRATVSEPEPGRVLAETIPDERGLVTTFTVEPREGGRRSHVTIATTWTSRGVQAIVERLLAPRLLRRIYAEELQKLARVAARKTSTGARA
ncbi:MAG TPA: SRPBCC family protein [Longimicrobiaceae bacterium]|nr:SRPBCC family protein [Longimicrobiaceae bacterium]